MWFFYIQFMDIIESNLNGYFFDINALITTNSKVWIIDKLKPNEPILKIAKSEFNLIKKGVYRRDDINLTLSGVKYWLSKDLMEKIKIKCKNNDLNISNLAFSLQEFMNKDIVDNNDFTIHIDNIRHIKNNNGDIYVLCSKNTKANYEKIISKLEDKLAELGLKVKSFYFISETFFNRDEDEIINTKAKILVQHLIGFKTEDNKFTHTELERYDTIYYYDDEERVIELAKNSNNVLEYLVSNSEDMVKERVKEIVRNNDCELYINKVTFNKLNLFLTTKIKLEWQNIIKTFESFKYKKDSK